MSDPFMSDPIPKTIPRSTLACPPAKNFTDQYLKSAQNDPKAIKPVVYEKGITKKDSEKDLGIKPLVSANTGTSKVTPNENFASTGTNFRASSKDIKQGSIKNLPAKQEPLSSKKGNN
jgi:hypothetical protein